MVVTPEEAIKARTEGANIEELCEQIDEFLKTPDGGNSALNLGDVNKYACQHIAKLYGEAGWIVEWTQGRDGDKHVRLIPR